jgi:hypothetical protein
MVSRVYFSRYLAFASVLSLAALLRFSVLDYNGPFIDESFLTFIDANVPYLTSDYRGWPLLSAAIYPRFGITGIRAVTAVFGVLTVAFVYKAAEILVLPFEGGDLGGRTPMFAALVFATSAPALFVSDLATSDSMAFMLFAFGFWQMTGGIERSDRVPLMVGAAALALAFATRYMVLMYLPLAVFYAICSSLLRGRKPPIHYFLIPLVLLVGAYGWTNGSHVLQAAHHAEAIELARGRAHVSRILGDAFILMVPVVILAFYDSFQRLLRRENELASSLQKLNVFFLVTSMLLVPAYHAVRGFSMTIEKNLTLSLFFGSILGGMACSRIYRLLNLGKTKNKTLAAAFSLLLAFPGIAVTRYYQTRWTDWRPVVPCVREAIEHLGLDYGIPGQIYFNANDGTLGNGHLLRADLGPIVSKESAWQYMNPEFRGLDIVEIAEKTGIPVVVAVFAEDFNEGDQIRSYLIGRKLMLPNVPPGRRHNGVRIDQVYLLVNSRHPNSERYRSRSRGIGACGEASAPWPMPWGIYESPSTRHPSDSALGTQSPQRLGELGSTTNVYHPDVSDLLVAAKLPVH